MRLAVVLATLVRHLGTYVELGAEAASEVRSAWMRRIVLGMIAAVAFIGGSCALWLAGLMAVWNSNWRMAYVVGSAVMLLLFAAVAGVVAMARPAGGPVTGALKSELRKDAELFQEWQSTIFR
jgi:MFS family permease